ncbi:hypothetical protein NITGR_580003 [Nitrospina gracilis 3/211]|uniref:Uncharacterized protein n=2 Tax=Nitrospina TaxID=35800 RepID=M1YKR4_NITG3|nr:hypothetical protein NITGR_580003 [Nitrospina gracilis 3/211]
MRKRKKREGKGTEGKPSPKEIDELARIWDEDLCE